MLEHRQLVGIVAHVIEQSLHQARRDRSAGHGDRAADGLRELIARQARHQEEPLVDRLRAGRGTPTRPQELRRIVSMTYWRRRLAECGEQLDERGGVILPACGVGETLKRKISSN